MYSYTNFWTSVLVFTQFFLCFGRTVQFPSTSVARIQTYRFMYQQTNIRLLLSYSAVIPTLDCTVGPQPMSVYIPHPDGTFRFSTHRSTIYSRNKVNISFCGTFLSSEIVLSSTLSITSRNVGCWHTNFCLHVEGNGETSTSTSNLNSVSQNGVPWMYRYLICISDHSALEAGQIWKAEVLCSAGLMKSEDQLNLVLAVLQPLTGKRRVTCCSSIVHEDVHSSEVVLDPLEGRQHIGLVTDVTFYRV